MECSCLGHTGSGCSEIGNTDVTLIKNEFLNLSDIKTRSFQNAVLTTTLLENDIPDWIRDECDAKSLINYRIRSATSRALSSAFNSDDDDVIGCNSDDGDIDNGYIESESSDYEEQCSFGLNFSRRSLKHLLFENTCICGSSKLVEDDVISGWKVIKKPRKSKSVRKRAKSAQIPSAYLRVVSSTKYNDHFKFYHYNDIGLYIKQYRMNHSVGDVCGDFMENDSTYPDPYDYKLRTNISALAQHYNFLEVYSLKIGNTDQNEENENEKKSRKVDDDDEDDDDEKLIKMSVKERGKNLNLAPVRASTAKRRSEIQISKKNLLPVNPYLNLIIPKTTLNQADLQLNIETRPSQTPRFEPSRVVISKAQTNFKETSLSYKSEPIRKTSPAGRANEVRILRTTAFPPDVPYSIMDASVRSSDSGFSFGDSLKKTNKNRIGSSSSSSSLKSFTLSPYTPFVKTSKNNQSNNSEDTLQPITLPPPLPPQPIESKKTDKDPEVRYRFKFLDSVQKMPERTKHDTVVPLSVGAFSLRGKTCVPEENQLLSIQKVRKERGSRTAVMSSMSSINL